MRSYFPLYFITKGKSSPLYRDFFLRGLPFRSEYVDVFLTRKCYSVLTTMAKIFAENL